MILCARPSAIAVLPTPGSPISTGLFFFLRESISITRVISSDLPITGSTLFCSASFVKSLENLSKVGVFDFPENLDPSLSPSPIILITETLAES